MSKPQKKLVLVHPPYSTATAPPLGVCYLKAFVDRTVSGWHAKVLDLNLEAQQNLIEAIGKRRCPGGPELGPRLMDEIALARADETFRGKHEEDFYDRLDRYFVYTQVWLRQVCECLSDPRLIQQGYSGVGPMPPFVERCAQRILDEEPAMVGVSICYKRQLGIGLCFCKLLKQWRPEIPIVVGGAFFNTDATASLTAHQANIDYIISGEGEQALARLLEENIDLEQVPGLVFAKDGQVIENAPAWEPDLDVLGAPDFSDLDLFTYYSPEPVVPVLTTRGCYWRRCTFCTHYRSAGHTYRQRSVDSVIEELRRHAEAGIRHFALIDEMISPAWFRQLADAIRDAKLQIDYYALAKPTGHFDRKLLTSMRDSGCLYVLWGLESGSQRILDLMDKGTTVTEIEQVLEAAREVGMKNHVFVIFGFPTETRQEFQETLDLLARHHSAIAMVHRGLFHLTSGSPIQEHPEKFSITRCWPTDTPPLYQFECSSGMSHQEVLQASEQIMPFLRGFAGGPPELGDFLFRDHALLMYGRDNKEGK